MNLNSHHVLELIIDAAFCSIPICAVVAPAILFASNQYNLVQIRRWVVGTIFTSSGLALTTCAGWLAFYTPILVEKYEPPHADSCLECEHKHVSTPDGHLYCSAFPPKAILDETITSAERMIRRFTGIASALIALVLSVVALSAGIARLVGGNGFQNAARRYLLELASLPLAFGFNLLSIGLQTIYPLALR